MPRITQNSLTSGELSPSCYGRTDLEQYGSGAALLKNFVLHPHGGISNRPGTKFIAETLGPGMLIGFDYSVTQQYLLEFTEKKMRIIKDGGLVIFPAGAGTDIVKAATYKWTASGHGTSEYRLELLAGGNPNLSRPEFVYEQADAEIQLIQSGVYKWTQSGATNEYYLEANAGGTPKLRLPDSIKINGTSITKGTLGSLAAGTWGYGDNNTLGYNTVYVRLADSSDPDSKLETDIRTASFRWIKSLKGINEYYLQTSAGADPNIDEPGTVKEFITTAGKTLVKATVGSLDAGEWAYDDNDSLGYDTIYVRLAGTGYADPDYKPLHYLKCYDTGFISAHYTPKTLTEGVPGSLTAGTWAYGDNDTLGYSTIYVRLTVAGDPDAEIDGFLEAGYVVEVTSPYAYADLAKLDFCQSADTMFFTHPDYPIQTLTRTDHHAWTFAENTFVSSLAAPTALAKTIVAGVSALAGTARELIYTVTAVSPKGEESAQSDPVSAAIVATWPEGGLIKLTWTKSAGADHYNIYKSVDGSLPGYIGSSTSTKFTDDYITPSADKGAPNAQNPFSGEGNYPGAVGIYQQRLMFGRTDNAPLTVFGSRNGAFNNFNTSTPLQDDDEVEYPLASNQVNEILYFVPLDDLIIITTGGPWTLSHGSASDAITPTSVQAKNEGVVPAHRIKPIIVGKSILLVELFGQIVRDLLYNFSSNSYEGTNLSILATHLFAGHTLQAWAYQRSPDSIIWCVRNDGALIAMTYLREHKVWGWHRHETDGIFESVCSIKGTDYDELYFIVKRNLGTEETPDYVRYIERLEKRFYEGDVEDAYFVDCGLTYDGAAATVISGLDHLEGKDVSVLADGNVISDMTVSGGSITLPHSASVVHVGLPYDSEFKSLPLDFSAAAGPMQGQKKNVSNVSLKFFNTRGGWMGPDEEDMFEFKYREEEGYSEATALYNGDKSITIPDSWRTDAQIYVKQTDPLPMTILSVSMEVTLGDN